MEPAVKGFTDDTKLIHEVKSLTAKGVSKEHLYVMSHDDDRTNRVSRPCRSK